IGQNQSGGQTIHHRMTGAGWTARLRLVLACLAAGCLVMASPAHPGSAVHRWAAPRLSGQATQVLPRLPGQQTPRVQDLLSSADAVLKEMSHITGLPIRAALKKQIVNRTEIRRYLADRLHAEYTPEDIHQQEATLKAFGLVSREFNLADFMVSFYT